MTTAARKAQGEPAANGFPLLKSPDEVALILQITAKSVHKLVREGKLSCVQVTARKRCFTDEQVQEYIRSRTIPTRVDKKPRGPVSSRPRRGGEAGKSVGVSGKGLREEMRRWR